MTEFSVKVIDQDKKAVQGAQVTVNGGFPQHTDETGMTHYNINEWSTQLRILATKGLSKAEGTISVDLFAVAHPDVLTIQMNFSLGAPIAQGLASVANYAWIVPVVIILGVLGAGVVAYLWLRKRWE